MRERSQDWLGDQFSLEGRRVLVTGASRGIGQAMAVGFARAGADVLVAARSSAALQVTEDLLRAINRQVECVIFDQGDISSIIAGLSKIGKIDVLVNNAGVEQVCPALDVTEQLWAKVVDTNLRGAFFVAQTVAKGMMDAASGSIINLASLTSFVGVPTAVPYGASKSGILGLTRALAAEWGPRGIRVNAIAPGYFHTDMTDGFYKDKQWVDRMISQVPLGRLGTLDDLVGTAIFLASPASRYITGQCLAVDGGYLASI